MDDSSRTSTTDIERPLRTVNTKSVPNKGQRRMETEREPMGLLERSDNLFVAPARSIPEVGTIAMGVALECPFSLVYRH